VKVWIDAQLSPDLAAWISESFGTEAAAVRELGFATADDRAIFNAARDAAAVVMTKDRDFVDLVERYGPPPQVIWLTCGNTSNAYLRALLGRTWPTIDRMIASGEALVEISAGMTRE
jgi:predicted nuclease of predicted toxin-antitoxin system